MRVTGSSHRGAAPTRHQAASRRGAAFLLLVAMVLLVVVGATQTLIRSEMMTRRGESDRVRLRSMTAALDAVDPQTIAVAQSVRLAVDEASDQFIEVSVNETKSRVSARWLKADKVVVEMHREIEQVESNQ